MLEVEVAGTRLVLLAERVAYWPQGRTLLVADAHLGKAASFRRLGVPVPQGTTGQGLHRLGLALAATGAERVVFLGDLLHSALAKAAATVETMRVWRQERAALEMTLIIGNHDRRAGALPPSWRVQCLEGPLRLGPFVLAHEPAAHHGGYTLCGHVHPGAVVAGRGRDRVRLPCFHFGPAVGVLPAFGEFTGLHVLRREPADRVYVIAADSVRALPHLNLPHDTVA